MSEREDGFYWVMNLYRVQRDSDVVRQRDELLAAVKSEVVNIQYTVALQKGRNISASTADILERSVAALHRAIARIEAEKSGVKP